MQNEKTLVRWKTKKHERHFAQPFLKGFNQVEAVLKEILNLFDKWTEECFHFLKLRHQLMHLNEYVICIYQ